MQRMIKRLAAFVVGLILVVSAIGFLPALLADENVLAGTPTQAFARWNPPGTGTPWFGDINIENAENIATVTADILTPFAATGITNIGTNIGADFTPGATINGVGWGTSFPLGDTIVYVDGVRYRSTRLVWNFANATIPEKPTILPGTTDPVNFAVLPIGVQPTRNATIAHPVYVVIVNATYSDGHTWSGNVSHVFDNWRNPGNPHVPQGVFNPVTIHLSDTGPGGCVCEICPTCDGCVENDCCNDCDCEPCDCAVFSGWRHVTSFNYSWRANNAVPLTFTIEGVEHNVRAYNAGRRVAPICVEGWIAAPGQHIPDCICQTTISNSANNTFRHREHHTESMTYASTYGSLEGGTVVRHTMLVSKEVEACATGNTPSLRLQLVGDGVFSVSYNAALGEWTWPARPGVDVNVTDSGVMIGAQEFYKIEVTYTLASPIRGVLTMGLGVQHITVPAPFWQFAAVYFADPNIIEPTPTPLNPGLYHFPAGYSLDAQIHPDATPMPLTPITVWTGPGETGTSAVHQAYTAHPGQLYPADAGQGWTFVHNGFRYVPGEDPQGRPLDYARGLSFTAFMPAYLARSNANTPAANVPHIRFDYTVRPLSNTMAWNVNSRGLMAQVWLIPQLGDSALGSNITHLREVNAIASGIHNTVIGNVNSYGTDPGKNWNFADKVWIDGNPYIQFRWSIEFDETVSVTKDEIIISFDIANMILEHPLFFADFAVDWHTGPFGGAPFVIDSPIYMRNMADSTGMNLNDVHIMTGQGAPFVTRRGNWGSEKARMSVTDEGIFATYIQMREGDFDERWISGGQYGFGNDDPYVVAFIFSPHLTPGQTEADRRWYIIAELPDSAGSPVIASDIHGNVYVISWGHPTREFIPGERRYRVLNYYYPIVIRYPAGSWTTHGNIAGVLGDVEMDIWRDFPSDRRGVNYYASANICPDGILYMISGGDAGAHTERPGMIEIVAFDTNRFGQGAAAWDVARLYADGRFNYFYFGFDAEGRIELFGNRNNLAWTMGYTGVGTGAYAWDALVYWRLGDFVSAIPTDEVNIRAGNVQHHLHPAGMQFVEVLEYIEIFKPNPADFPGAPPALRPNHHGDAFWDVNGDIHIIFGLDDQAHQLGGERRSGMWHAYLRETADGKELVFSNFLNIPQNYTIIFNDTAGNFYFMHGSGDAQTVFQATGFSDAGWAWTNIGAFDLPVPMRENGTSQAYNFGRTGHGAFTGRTGRYNEIHIMYPTRNALTSPLYTSADQWVYMLLDIDTCHRAIAAVAALRALNWAGLAVDAEENAVAAILNFVSVLGLYREFDVQVQLTGRVGDAIGFAIVLRDSSGVVGVFRAVVGGGEYVQPIFSLQAFNNGVINNQSLYNGGLIRIWTRLDGENALVTYENLTVEAVFPNGGCAMDVVRVNQVWTAPEYVNMIDVNFRELWQYIYLTVTYRGQVVDLLLINPVYTPVTVPEFTLSVFNNEVINNQSLADAGLIRIWTVLDGVAAPVPYADANITAVLPDGTSAMEFVRANEMWNNPGNLNVVDVNFNGNWQRIYFTITAYGQTLELTLINPRPRVLSLNIFNNGNDDNASLAAAGLIRMWTRLNGEGADITGAVITAVDQDGVDAMQFVTISGPAGYVRAIDVNKFAQWQTIDFTITAYGQTIEVLLINNRFEP